MSRLVYQTAKKMARDSFKIYIKKVRSDKDAFRFHIETSLADFTGGMYDPKGKQSLSKTLKDVFNSCIRCIKEKGSTFVYANFTVVFNTENYIEGTAQFSFHKDQDHESGYHTFSMINDSIWQTVPMSQEEINMFSEAFIVLRNSIEVKKL